MGLPELWQVYDSDGNAVAGRGEEADAFAQNPALYMGNSHIWLWRDFEGSRQVLVQKRADHVARRPGYLHASASGHVNVNESALGAAVRESFEELGVRLDERELKELFMLQGGLRNESFNYVYAYKAKPDLELVINPDEVQSVSWIEIHHFDSMRARPEDYMLIDLGQDYFSHLIGAIADL